MKILEYGSKEKDILLLINGFQCPYQSLNEYIEYYKNKFHIIIPILPGHNPDLKEEFISFDSCVKEIEEYIIPNYGNKIYAIYGISMGGAMATHLWQHNKLEIQKLILESSPIISYGKLITSILSKLYLNITQKVRNRDEKIIKKAINNIVTDNNLNEFLSLIDNMSDKTIKKYLEEIGKTKLPKNINNKNTEITYFYGSKLPELIFKIISKNIRKKYKNIKTIYQKGKKHCEDALLNPKIKIKQLDKILLKIK